MNYYLFYIKITDKPIAKKEVLRRIKIAKEAAGEKATFN